MDQIDSKWIGLLAGIIGALAGAGLVLKIRFSKGKSSVQIGNTVKGDQAGGDIRK